MGRRAVGGGKKGKGEKKWVARQVRHEGVTFKKVRSGPTKTTK